MSKVLPSTALALTLVLNAPWLQATDYYVAPPPNGNDDHDGSLAAPFATLAKAQDVAQPGDTFYFRGGTYAFSSSTSPVGIVLDSSGSSAAPIRYFAYEGETPVFDFSAITTAARIKGISVTADWIHLRGFEITNVPQNVTDQKESWGIHVEGGNNNVFERLNIHDVMGPGLFISEGGDNLVLNCDSHHNYDENSYSAGPTPGENADGFGCHADAAGNVFRGCRAWYNSDDGFDFINSPGLCVVEHSWAFRNGYIPDTDSPIGNGAGIKAGGFGDDVPATIPRHRVLFNVSFRNRRQGFYANHHEGGIDWLNNTAFDNGQRNFDLLADEGPAAHLLRNNVAFGSGGSVDNLTTDEVDDAFNSWNLSVMANTEDFTSLDHADATAPRNADGTLPAVGFAELVAASDLIDQGEDRGFPYNGGAPDLGAFESSAPPSHGGSAGSGGAAASGGSADSGGSKSSVAGRAGQAAGAASGAGGAGVAGAGTSSSVVTSGSSGTPDAGGCACRSAPAGQGRSASGLWLLVMAACACRRRRGRVGRPAVGCAGLRRTASCL